MKILKKCQLYIKHPGCLSVVRAANIIKPTPCHGTPGLQHLSPHQHLSKEAHQLLVPAEVALLFLCVGADGHVV